MRRAPDRAGPWRLPTRARVLAVALSCAGLALATRPPASARAEGGSLAEYEIASSEGGSSRGVLTVAPDYSIVRRVTYPDTSVHTYVGKGSLSGAVLSVRFESSGEPRNLGGEWTVQGETDAGNYRGTAVFALHHGRWVGTYQPASEDDDERLPPVEISGKWSGLSFVGERRVGERRAGDPRVGDAAPLASTASAAWTLSPDGLALTISASTTRETFTRPRLPVSGLGPTATYSFEEGGKLRGQLSSGSEDRGDKVVIQASTTDAARKVAPDPVPSSLRAIHDTRILKTADRSGTVAKEVRQGELVPVCGREGDFWVVGPFAEPGQRRGWKGYLPAGDLDNRLRYADVPAPIFLTDRPPSASSVVQRDLGTCYLDAALMAIASVQSHSIESMIRDHGDGTVSVRFFRRSGGDRSGGDPAPEWVTIRKTIIVDERGRSHYTVGEGGQLWPALVEKAFAAWRGEGWYRNIEGGSTADVFEVVLGLPARSLGWELPLPSELGQQRRGGGRRGRTRDIPTLGAEDQKAIAAYRDSDAGKKDATSLPTRPDARRDLAHVQEQLAALVKGGLSEAGSKSLLDFYTARLDGPLGSGQYGAQAKEIYKQIKSALEAHLPIAMSTRSWGASTAGEPTGRENLEVVPGLASEHEYMVTEAYEDDAHLCWVKVVNPWHRFSRRYEREGTKLVARASSRRQDTEGGAFAVELSDVLRYYSAVSTVARR